MSHLFLNFRRLIHSLGYFSGVCNSCTRRRRWHRQEAVVWRPGCCGQAKGEATAEIDAGVRACAGDRAEGEGKFSQLVWQHSYRNGGGENGIKSSTTLTQVTHNKMDECRLCLFIFCGFGVRDVRYPFTPGSDRAQISPAASPVISHHTVWRTWLFIAYSDDERFYY